MTELLRYRYSFALVLAGFAVIRPAGAQPRMIDSAVEGTEGTADGLNPMADSAPCGQPVDPQQLPYDRPYPGLIGEGAGPGFDVEPQVPLEPLDPFLSKLEWFGLHHSSTNGRSVGLGVPLVGTSWLNRPYYVGGDVGTLWITRSIFEDVTRDTDAFGGVFIGWDRDHYWGAELWFDWSTPELINEEERDARRTDSLFMWSYSLLYYPWGDSMWRPYWRCGIGDTHVDFPLDDGSRHDEWLLSFPLGVGVKYSVRRWLAARAEFTDHLTVDDGRVPTLNNLSLTFGLEWHFGAHPRSYWPWNPSRHIW